MNRGTKKIRRYSYAMEAIRSIQIIQRQWWRFGDVEDRTWMMPREGGLRVFYGVLDCIKRVF